MQRILFLGLFLFSLVVSGNSWSAVSASTSTSTTGSYTISWSSGGGTVDLLEVKDNINNGRVYRGSARSYSFSGKAAGTYKYRVHSESLGQCYPGWGCFPALMGTVTVTVTTPPASVSISASPSSLPFTTTPFTLSWNSVSTSSCSGSGVSISGKSGSKSVTLSGWAYQSLPQVWTKTISVTCSANSGGSVSKSLVMTADRVPPKPTVNVSWNANSALVGQSSTFSWSTSDTSSCKLNGSTVSVNGSQSTTFTSSGSVTKTVVCTNAQGSTSRSDTISVTYPAPGRPGAISAPSTASTGSYTVSWGASSGPLTEYRLDQRANGGGWSRVYTGTSRSASFSKTADNYYEYRVVACNHGVCGSYTAVRRVTIPKGSVTLTASPASLSLTNQAFTLSWNSVMASSCSGSGVSLSGKSGSKSVTLSGWAYQSLPDLWTKSISISCSVIGGGSVSKTLVMTADRVPPKPTVNASWNANSALVGQSSTFSWSTADTSSCKLNGSTVSVNGSQSTTFSSDASVTKTVVCTNAQGSTTRSDTISVAYPAPGKPGAISAPSTASTGIYTVSWGVSSGPLTEYRLQESANGGGWSTVYTGTLRSAGFTKTADKYYDYRVVACNHGVCGSYTAVRRVTIPKGSVTLTASPASLSLTNQGFTLSWNSVMASSCSGSGVSLSGKSGSKSVTLSGWAYQSLPDLWTKSISISCSIIGGGSVSKTLVMTADRIPPKPTVNVSWSVSSALVGQSAIFSWSTADTSSCELNGSTVGVSGSQSTTFSSDGSVSKTVVCTNAEGSTSRSASISVTYPAPGTPGAISAPSTASTGIYTVSWGASSGPLTEYRLQERANGGGWSTVYSGTLRSAGFTKTADNYYDYQVVACNHGVCGSYAAARRVTIPKASVSLTASPGALTFTNQEFTLNWGSVMTSSCSGSGVAISGTSGSKPVTLSGWTYESFPQVWTKSMTVTCNVIGGGSVSKVLVMTADRVPPKPTVNVSWNTSNVLVGLPATFSWNTTDTASCTLDDVSVSVNGSRQFTFDTDVTVSKTLVCVNAQGSTSATATVSVAFPAMPTVEVSWDKTSTFVGETATFSWAGQNAYNCYLDGGSVENSGSRLVTLNNAAVHEKTVSCDNAVGSVSDSSSIVVFPNDSEFPVPVDPADDLSAGETFMGYVNGSLQVGASGNASYSVPVDVPPGIRGMQPNLSIAYNSGATNGIVGWGWNVSGLSRIHRCSASLVRDGYRSSTQDGDDFKMCLDGQRLVETSPGEYRTERESYKKIVANDDGGFTVFLKNGREVQYGVRDDARRESRDGTSYVDWHINRITDIADNYMTYHYEKDLDNGRHRIQRIEYTKNEDSNADGVSHSVVFHYQDRVDISSGYWAGVFYKTDQRLNRIEVLADGSLVRQYELNYQQFDGVEYADPVELSRLSGIKVCYDYFSVQCTEPLTLTWSSRRQSSFGFDERTIVDGVNDDYAERLRIGDFDGDGVKENLIVKSSYNSDTGITLSLYLLEQGEEFTESTSQLITTLSDLRAPIQGIGDINADGFKDILVVTNSYPGDSVSYGSENGFAQPTPLTGGAGGTVIEGVSYQIMRRDFNGDGFPDMLRYRKYSDGVTPLPRGIDKDYEVSINEGNGHFGDFELWGQGEGIQPNTLKMLDMNGDGLLDLVNCDYYSTGSDPDGNFCATAVLLNNGSGFNAQATWLGGVVAGPTWTRRADFGYVVIPEGHMQFADINGDSLPDIVWADKNKVKVALNSGQQFEAYSVWLDEDITPQHWQSPPFSLIDINVDGKLDMVIRVDDFALEVAYNMGTHFASPVALVGLYGNAFAGMDIDDNGSSDIRLSERPDIPSEEWHVNQLGNRIAVNRLPVHLITSFQTNDENSVGVSYRPITDPNVHTLAPSNQIASGTIATFERMIDETIAIGRAGTPTNFSSRVARNRQLVETTYTNLGDRSLGGIIQTSYRYTGHLRHRSGWGSLGFKKVQMDRVVGTTGERSRVISEYSQEIGDNFNAAGLLLKTTRYAFNNDGEFQQISDTVNQWQVQTIADDIDTGVGANSPHYSIHRVASHTAANDLNAAAIAKSSSSVLSYAGTAATSCVDSPQASVSVVTTAHAAYDSFGNVHQTASLTCDGSHIFTTTNKQQYENKTSDEKWVLGLVTNAKTTATAPDAGGTLQSLTREQAATYNADGLPLTETREPNNTSLTHTTTLSSYDVYGTPGTISEAWNDTSGLGFGSRSSTVGVIYQDDGTRTITTTNALNQQTVSVMDGRFGELKSYTDINDLTTTTTFDDLGRIDTVTSADLTSVVNNYYVCDNCEAQSDKARFYVHSKATGASSQRSYFDAFGRDVGQRVIGLTGQVSFTQIAYNTAGRVEFTSQPFYDGGYRYDTEYDYDGLGRATHVTAPDTGLTATQYNGLETTVTNALLQQRVQWNNAIGQNIRTQDNLGSEIEYSYDPFGNLIQTLVSGHDVSVDVITTMGYDLLGRQEYLDDSSAGRIDYTYNGLDLMVTSTDANLQQTAFTYDALGRQKRRIDDATEANTSVRTHNWSYDGADNGKGLVNGVSGFDTEGFVYTETYQYNAYGLPSQSRTTIQGETYDTETHYDAYNRPVAIEYPTGYTVVNHYNTYGYRDQINDALSGSSLWEATAADAFGNVTSSEQGNGVITTREYDPATGRVNSIHAMSHSTTLVVQNQDFIYDELGNLQERTDQRVGVGFVQAFCYDTLNRLKASREGSCSVSDTDVDYDALGNIITRLMDGNIANTYTYDSANPYKLVSTTLGGTYGYDDNGNITSGDGRSITYTSFDKPKFMSQDGNTVDITYSSDQNRIRRVDNDAITTFYVSGIYEKREEDGITSHVHYVGDIALHVWKEENDAISDIYTRYLHHDNLGSIVAKTDENAGSADFSEWMANDPWGLRQDESWAGSILDTSYQPSDTRKGFTGHEHLDGIGLIHMNGRVYDPGLGRFLSVDPLVQDPSNTQSFNRYAYVWNNPLSMTDPSGFEGVSDVSCPASRCGIVWIDVPDNVIIDPGLQGNSYEIKYEDGQLISEGGSGMNFFVNLDADIGDIARAFLSMVGDNAYNQVQLQAYMKAIGLGGDGALNSSGLSGLPGAFSFGEGGLGGFSAAQKGPSLWDRVNLFSAYNAREWGALTGIDQYEGTASTFTESEKFLIQFLGSGGGAVPGKLSIPNTGSALTKTDFKLGYHPRVWQRAAQDGGFHKFPTSIDKMVLTTKPQVFSSGYRMYRMEGSMYGGSKLYKGHYEIGVHRSGIIDHRMFRPLNPK